ncbi:MAG: hypothetical protein RIE53_13325 [Rhodothermales bacterium]
MPGDRHHLSALDVEDALDGLRVRHSHTEHLTHRLVGVLLFLTDDLGRLDPFQAAASFADDVLDLLPTHGDIPDLDGVDPMILEEGGNVVARLAALEGCARILPDLRRSSDALLAMATFQYVRLGSQVHAHRLLQHRSPGADTPSRGGLEKSVLQDIRTHRPAWESMYTACMNNADRRRRERRNSAIFPVVPTVHHASTRRVLTAGYTRTLTCTIAGRSTNGDSFDTIFNLDGDPGAATRTPLSAGRTLLRDHEPALLRRTFQGTFSLDGGGAVHSGESAGLAMALLYFCAVVQFSGRRREWSVRPDCVLTGAVDDDGYVLPVDPGSIRAKTAAAFFSGANLFVLPRVHLDEAETALAILRQRYPERQLEVRGIQSVHEAAADRRIVHSEKRGLVNHVLRQFWMRKWLVAAVFAGVILGISAMIWRETWIDPYPHTWSWDETSYVVLNSDGQELFRLSASRETIIALQTGSQGFRPAVLSDLNGDGFKDLVALDSRQLLDGDTGLLHIADGRTHRVRTLDIFDMELPYDRDLSVVHGRMSPWMVIAGDYDQNGTSEIYVAAIHDFYPTVVMKLDAMSGAILDVYHHSGVFRAMMALDLDDDGRAEIVLGGTNNAFDQAVIVVLDPERFGGFGPSQGVYQPGPGPTGHERLYLRLPRTGVGRLAPPPFPVVNEIRPMLQDRLIQFTTWEAMLRRVDNTLLNASIYLYLDSDLRGFGMGTTDSYDGIWDRLNTMGLEPPPLDSTFMATFVTGLERWTSQGWVPHPVSPRSKM